MLVRRSALACIVVVTAVASTVGAGGCFSLDRSQELVPGGVVGRCVDLDGRPVATNIRLDGSALHIKSDDEGRFVLAGLQAGTWPLAFAFDGDGDGGSELAAHRAVTITKLDDGTLSSVLLGDVTMEGTIAISGRAVDDGGAPVAGVSVVVTRSVDQLEGGGGAEPRELGVENAAGADDEGRFLVPDVAVGKLHVTAVGSGFASAPFDVDSRFDVDVGDLALEGPGERAVDVVIVGAGGDVAVNVFARGGDRGDAPVFAQSGVATLTVPYGLYDVFADDGSKQGTLLDRLAAPGQGNLTWGNLLVVEGDPCDASRNDLTDRDGDGAQGLPPPSGFADPLWVSCTADCRGAFGDQSAACDVDGVSYDCDDDGDGQPDVTEPTACLDVCAGGDHDGDGICDRADTYPLCAGVCPAGESPFSPPPPLFEGEEGEGEGEGEEGEGEGEGGDVGGEDDPGVLVVPGVVAVDLAGGSDIDCYAFSSNDPKELVLRVDDGNGCATNDVKLRLLDGAGAVIAADDDSFAKCPVIDRFLVSGAYRVCVEATDATGVNALAVDLDAVFGDIGGASAPLAAVLPVNVELDMTFNPDEDCLAVPLVTGEHLSAIVGALVGQGANPALTLRDSGGAALGTPSTGVFGNPRVHFTAASDVDARVCLQKSNANQLTLPTLEIATDAIGGPEAPSTVTPSIARIDSAGDVDCFRITPPAGQGVVRVLSNDVSCFSTGLRTSANNVVADAFESDLYFYGQNACTRSFISTDGSPIDVCVQQRSVALGAFAQGDYAVALDVDDNGPAAPAAIGTAPGAAPVSLTPFDRDCFTFDVAASGDFIVRVVDDDLACSDGGVALSLSTPTGERFSVGGFASCVGIGEPLNPGRHTVCTELQPGVAAKDFELQVLRDADGGALAPSLTLLPGGSVDLDLDVLGELECATINVATTTSVVIDNGFTNSTLTLRDVDGVVFRAPDFFNLFDNNAIEQLLAPGSYRACVTGGNGVPVGPITVRRADDNDAGLQRPSSVVFGASTPIVLAAPDLDCFAFDTANNSENVVTFVPEGGCDANFDNVVVNVVHDGFPTGADGNGGCRFVRFNGTDNDVVCLSDTGAGVRGTLVVNGDNNGFDFPSPTNGLPVDSVVTLGFVGDNDCVSFTPDDDHSEVVITVVDDDDAGCRDVQPSGRGGAMRTTNFRNGCGRVEGSGATPMVGCAVGNAFAAAANGAVHVIANGDDNGAGRPTDINIGDVTALDADFAADVDCVRFTLDAPGDVVVAVSACDGAHDVRIAGDGFFGGFFATGRGDAGSCASAAASLPAGSFEACVGADVIGSYDVVVVDNPDGANNPGVLDVGSAVDVSLAVAGDSACFNVDTAATPSLVVSTPDDVDCRAQPVVTARVGTNGFQTISNGCGPTVLFAGVTEICVSGRAAGDVHLALDTADVDATEPPHVGAVTSARVSLADEIDEDCVAVDAFGSALSARVFSFVQCQQLTLTVRDADDPSTVLRTQSGFCSTEVQLDIAGRVQVCAKANAANVVGIDIVVDDVSGRADSVLGAAVDIGGVNGVSGVIDGNVDSDCFAVTASGTADRVFSFNNQAECRGRSFTYFKDGAGIDSGSDCGPPRSMVIPDGAGVICVRSSGPGAFALTSTVDDDSDFVTPHAVPFDDLPVAPGNGVDCRRVTFATADSYDIDLNPVSGRCADNDAFVRAFAVDGTHLFSDFIGNNCGSTQRFFDAGDVIICPEVSAPSTLRIASSGARVQTPIDGECAILDEGSVGELTCPAGTISDITFGRYTFNGSGSCDTDAFVDDPCSLDVTDNPALAACVGQTSCDVDVNTTVFSDACRFSFKELQVQFTCSDTVAPVHQWTFNGNTNDLVGGANGVLVGGATLNTGKLVLDGANDLLRTSALGAELRDRTLVVWVSAQNLVQRGGGVFTLDQGNGLSDGLAFGEFNNGLWGASSDGFQRSFGGDVAEVSTGRVMMALRYREASGVQLFRDAARNGSGNFFPVAAYDGNAHVVFGVLNESAVANTGSANGFDSYFAGAIDEARVYDRALTVADLAALNAAGPVP